MHGYHFYRFEQNEKEREKKLKKVKDFLISVAIMVLNHKETMMVCFISVQSQIFIQNIYIQCLHLCDFKRQKSVTSHQTLNDGSLIFI